MHNTRVCEFKGNAAVIMSAIIPAAILLIAVTGISMATTTSVFAYETNQAKSDVNSCGNGVEPTNVGCQNTDSQIQGDRNTVALSARQTFPVEEGPPTCEECFAPILDAGFPTEDLVIALAVELGLEEPPTTGAAVEAICQGLVSGDITVSEVSAAVDEVFPPEDEDLGISLIECLSLIFGGGG